MLLLCCITQLTAQAQFQDQKHTNIWYFGTAGLDFNSGKPVPLTNSAMDAFEGTASIADDQGNLLFYSDGTTVWNKQHQVMANGSGLLGHSSSAQSCLIVPKPGSKTIYYLFTTDNNGRSNGLRYSTIDMSRAGGLGEVTEKNILLYTPTAEKLTATLHQNKKDIWVVSHEYGSNTYYSYLVTENGIKTVATKSSIGNTIPSDLNGVSAIGCMKISPDGSKIAVTNFIGNSVQIFAFDKTTGMLLSLPSLSSSVSLPVGTSPYGVEFSPDNTKLYVTVDAGTRLIQYDLSSNLEATIIASRREVAQINLNSSTRYVGNSLQLGPDGKIYVAKVTNTHIGVINNPNAAGAAINYVDNGVDLGGRKSQMGLPAFIQSYFSYSYDVKYTLNCFGQPSHFSFDAPPWEQPTFMQWDFGDPASGANNTSSNLSASHNFSAPGTYTVTFTRHINNKTETYAITFQIQAPPVVDLGPERKICPGASVTLGATIANANYTWSTGATSPTITTSTPGTYWVDVKVGNCTTRATVKVSHLPLPVVNLGPDKELCQGDVLGLNAFNQGTTYRWQDGSTDATFRVTSPGTYRVEVTNAEGCTVVDEINIKYNDLPVVNLGPDKDICANTTITLDATQSGMTYRWQDGSTAPTFTVRAPGKYSVTLTNSKGCSATGSININHLPLPVVNLGRDTTLCTGETLLLNATFPNSTYLWQDGSTSPTFTVKESGTYWVDVTNEFGCTVRDQIWVPYLVRPTIFLGNDTTLCYGDTLVIGRELPGGVKYKWQDGSTEAKLTVTKPGVYKLSAYNQHCEANDEIRIKFKDCVGGLFVPNIITPNGDGLNDVFFVHGLMEDNWELKIYSRWGKEVYRANNYKNDWAPPAAAGTGVYFYHLTHPATGRTYKGSLEVVF
ncbi:T9SS type B sorting domain-containing protein [Pontibacter cellulosilyticus]|uniref:Gliding motility-associated C-terminal domain-containing protein n=1 Tax=Pontibacter cellulosilyticus TaxID=1720253 RepID=A0A923N9V7_9BACT|nr:gliding motility-associated C-terminal domain-containing protein [Pontibacter cellulosilyticus]MBC5994941.1 gliding motility-associated C-terminal domain-containing protein [Pontibacter cellulosilyticus]